MKMRTPISTIVALALLGTPLAVQAQNPNAIFNEVKQLRSANKTAEALKLTEKMIAIFGNPENRVGKQFAYYAPFFIHQHAEMLAGMGEYDKACETLNDLATNARYKSKAMLEGAKALPDGEDGYLALLSMATFQQGLVRYKQAVGTADKPGDPEAFAKCIPLLEAYLEQYDAGKVSKKEKQAKYNSIAYLRLLQAYLLQKTPDFKKAGEYMTKMGRTKSLLPDDMVMEGLDTVMRVAGNDPSYIGWTAKMIKANPGNFHVAPYRLARYISVLYNHGIKSIQMMNTALENSNLEQALSAVEAANLLLGTMPDTAETQQSTEEMAKILGERIAADRYMGTTYNGVFYKKLAEQLEDMVANKRELEAYGMLQTANAMVKMGSNRLAKAGYKVLIDRYPQLAQGEGEKRRELRDINYLQYSQLCNATGDEKTAAEYEAKVNPSNVGDGNKNVVAINKMVRFTKEQQWDKALPAADEVLAAVSAQSDPLTYVAACFSKIAACYSLHRMEEAAKQGEELLKSGLLQVKEGGLTQEQVNNYEPQTLFFMMDAYRVLGEKEPKNLDRAIEIGDEFIKKYPSINLEENKLAPNVYFDAITTLLKRNGHGDENAMRADKERALRFCDVIAKNWKEHEVYPTARLLAGSILINGDDDKLKPQGLVYLEEAVPAALKLKDGKGKSVASNALFWLASFSPEYDPREGEDEAGKQARIKGYFDTFWKDVDAEGDDFSLQMAILQLGRAVEAKDKGAYESCLKRAQDVIGREATHAFRNSTQNPELERSLNSFVEHYVNGEKQIHNKDLTLEEKKAYLMNFPGVEKDDQYTNAILRMALLNSMTEAWNSAKRAGKTEEATALERDRTRFIREMRDAFKPEVLTNYICVKMGQYELENANRFPAGSEERRQSVATALTYFEQVLSRNKDQLNEATLGKAQALTLSDDKAQQQEAHSLYTKLIAVQNPEVAGPALIGLTDLNINTGNYRDAVDSASKFMNIRGGGTQRQRAEMQLKLAKAFCESGQVQEGIQTYVNIYSHNFGNISVSAPAVTELMRQYWKRNTPAKGDRMKKYSPSDRWIAWNTGRGYVQRIRQAKIEQKMSASDRDLFNEVVLLVDEYGKDSAVQREEKANNDFQSKVKK